MSRHVYIYSPSSAVRDRNAFKRGVRRLKALGYEVEIDADCLSRHQRFAGDDATRVAAIGRAAASGARVALISRGGYGLTRLLPDLPYTALARAIEQGTAFVGFSDFTALQSAVLARTGAATWAGPALCDDFTGNPANTDAGGPDEITEACFEDLVSDQAEGVGWRMPLVSEPGDAIKPPQLPADWQTPVSVLWGGNLAVLCSLVGTPWLPAVNKGLLFLEDVGEHPYRIERMLTQLLHAGVLAKQRAIILGHFNGYKAAPHDRGFKMATVVERLRMQLKIPVLQGLPFGHVPTKVVLPVGARVRLQVSGRDALMVWGHR